MRIGIGWDRHRLVPGRRCVLGGVVFPECPVGPEGHSDGDALTHAVIDALLGAAALGDIGRHFPDTDAAWAGADSLELLARSAHLILDAGWRVVNVDTTLIAERPWVAARTVEMAAALATPLGLPALSVSIKATRGEGLGPEGRGECVTALAIVLLAPRDDGARGASGGR